MVVTLPAPTNQAGRLYRVQVQAESVAGASAMVAEHRRPRPVHMGPLPRHPAGLADADVEAICRYASYIIEAEWDGIADKAADANGDGTAEWSDPGSGTTSTYTVAQPGRVERELHRRHWQRHPGPRGQVVGHRPLVAGGGDRPRLPAHREIDRGRGHLVALSPRPLPGRRRRCSHAPLTRFSALCVSLENKKKRV